MSRPSTSYTLRIPKDLRRLLEAEAARTECTLAATVVNMCWMGLEVRGGGLVNCPPAKERLKGATLVPATHGQVGGDERLPPDMQVLREICAGKLPGDMPKGATGYKLSLGDEPIVEVEFCGKTWWEDGEQYECLMDKGHKELKHGMRGMVRKLDA